MNENPLGYVEVNKLIKKFAMPSVIGMLVTSIYNIVDQLFIGQAVGQLGNAATNVAFPLTFLTIALALLFGIGGAANFNLSLGQQKKEEAPYFIGNAFMLLVMSGVILLIISRLFLHPMLIAFGSPDEVLPYADTYVAITSIGFPFVLVTVGGGHLVRADGSPAKAMIYNLSGAIINIFLDYLLTMVFKFGIAGAAYATVIGQIFSAILVIRYMTRCKTVKLSLKHLALKGMYVKRIVMLGMSACVNQVSMMAVQIIANNLLKKYGADSIYGSSIPIACAGIVMKINQVIFSIVIGISQGCQPIFSFNYGARKFDRVRKTYKIAVLSGVIISAIAFAVIEIFPLQIFSAFGNGSSEYLEYGVLYLRVYLLFVILSAMQPVTNTFFAAIGKPAKGMLIALLKQVIIMLPAMLILTPLVGVNGVMYSNPISDVIAGVFAIVMVVIEFRKMKKLEMTPA